MLLFKKVLKFTKSQKIGEFMKKLISVFLCAATFCFCAAAQSSEKLTELIGTNKATYGQTAYLCEVYSGKIDESATYEQAFEALKQDNYASEKASADTQITLAELSFICANAADLKGGLFYTLFPSPRYAFRELKAKGIIPMNADPDSKVTGRNVIAVFNGCFPSQTENAGE